MKLMSGPAEVTLQPEKESVPEDWDNTMESELRYRDSAFKA